MIPIFFQTISFKVNKRLIIAIMLVILSIILYIIAPDIYSYNFCNIIFVFYIISSIWVIKRTIINNNYFNFHVLFLISFFFVNFIYPSILYPISPEYFPVYKKSFNQDVISKATALAFIGSSSYILGVFVQHRNKIEYFSKPNINFKAHLFILTIILFLTLLVLTIFGGTQMIKGVFGSTSNIPPGFLVFTQVIIALSVILILYSKNFDGTILDLIRKFNKPIMVFLLYFLFIFIFTGDRGPAIQILLITLGLISIYIRPIKIKEFLLIMVIGMLLMTFVSYARSKSINSNESGLSNFVDRGTENIQLNSFFDIGMDLIVNNRNLYVGYDYANKNGFSYGTSMFHYLFSPVPFLPTMLTEFFFDKPPDELTSAYIITKEARSTYGLGTNMIADLYMSFGIIGVIFFMFLLGYVVAHYHSKSIYGNRIISLIIYVYLLGFSIYLPRTSILDSSRHIIWSILLFILLNRIVSKFTKEFKHKSVIDE